MYMKTIDTQSYTGASYVIASESIASRVEGLEYIQLKPMVLIEVHEVMKELIAKCRR